MLKTKLSAETVLVIEVTAKYNDLSADAVNRQHDRLNLYAECAAKKDTIDELQRDYSYLKESYRILKEQDATKFWLVKRYDDEYKELKADG